MAKKLILGAVLGGMAAVGWGAISRMVLPWHGKTLNTFTNEIAVANVVTQNAPKAGVYLLLLFHWQHPTAEQQTAPKGFMLFGTVRHDAPDMR